MSTAVLTPWGQQARQIHLSVREGGQPTGRVLASEHRIHEMLASDDPAVRRKAILHLNAVARTYTDTLIQLSSPALFPDQKTQGVPSAVSFGEADRRAADTRWTALYNIRDLRSASSPYFKITDVYNAVTFEVYLLGERIKMRHVQGTEVIFETDIVAGGLQWNQFFAMWQDLWSANEGIATMQLKYAQKQARAAYEVLTASGLTGVAYNTTGATTLEKDILTINDGIRTIGNQLYQDEGIAGIQTEEDIEGAALFLLYNPATQGYRQRVNRALNARFTMANDNMSIAEVDVPVIPLPSRYVPATDWKLMLPGRKNIAAIHKDLEIYDHTDPRVAGVADGRIGQGAYKMVRGDAKQGVSLATS
ncbi:MAG: hypothetical protein AAGF99_05170 [Bacteroidota bacterium]